jgi:hypothetical protein
MKKVKGITISLFVLGSIVFALGFSENHEPPAPPSPDASIEEHMAWKKEFLQWAEHNGRLTKLTGESTKGMEIEIAGQPFVLPEETYLDGVVVVVDDPDEELTALVPYYVIKKGSSYMLLSINTGIVIKQHTPPGEQDAFKDFATVITGYFKEVK